MSEAESAEGAAKIPGFVYTFYSFKGGVGRSMALANVAALLATWGKRVLVVDWDLEAPGLEVFFQQAKLTTSGRKDHDGVVDLLEGLQGGESRDWRKCLLRMKLGAKGLDLLMAGRKTDDYQQRVQRLDWPKLFDDDHRVGNYVDQLRREWKADYDFVLIDSRTGFTDIGDICTVLLPDALVLLFVSNYQNVDGVLDLVKRAQAARDELPVSRSRLVAIPVAARDEVYNEYDKSKTWKAIYKERLGHLYRSWLPKEVEVDAALNKLFVPYVTNWSFGERLPVIENPQEIENPASISAAYGRLATLLMSRLDFAELAKGVDPHELAAARAAERAAVQEAVKAREEAQATEQAALGEATKARAQAAFSRNISIVLTFVGLAWLAWSTFRAVGGIEPAVSPDASVNTARQTLDDEFPRATTWARKQSLVEDCLRAGCDAGGLRLDTGELQGLLAARGKLKGALFNKSKLQRADFTEATLEDADLREAELSTAILRSANLSKADLRGADLSDTDLRDAVFDGARLEGASFSGARLEGASFKDVVTDEKTEGLGLDAPIPSPSASTSAAIDPKGPDAGQVPVKNPELWQIVHGDLEREGVEAQVRNVEQRGTLIVLGSYQSPKQARANVGRLRKLAGRDLRVYYAVNRYYAVVAIAGPKERPSDVLTQVRSAVKDAYTFDMSAFPLALTFY